MRAYVPVVAATALGVAGGLLVGQWCGSISAHLLGAAVVAVVSGAGTQRLAQPQGRRWPAVVWVAVLSVVGVLLLGEAVAAVLAVVWGLADASTSQAAAFELTLVLMLLVAIAAGSAEPAPPEAGRRHEERRPPSGSLRDCRSLPRPPSPWREPPTVSARLRVSALADARDEWARTCVGDSRLY